MRPTWDEYFLEIANVAKKRSTCLRRQVGAVITRGNRILATGYNGVPTGITHCDKKGCIRNKLNIPSGERHELCRGSHAEQNAIVNAANFGISLRDSTLYVTVQPCMYCTKMIINAGITRIVYESGYPDELSLEMLEESGIELVKM